MKRILSRTGPNLELNALFIQPTRWCGLNCQGCYVKDHKGGEADFHTDWSEQLRLFKYFYNGPHWANQITIAIDDLPRVPGKESRHMLLIASGVLDELRALSRAGRQGKPEVHMTLHTPGTYEQYANEYVRGWEGLSVISFSVLSRSKQRDMEIVRAMKELGVLVNWNKTINPGKYDYEDQLDKMIKVGREVDHINLVMFKRPIGSGPGPRIPVDGTYMRQYLLYIAQVVDKLPADVRRKISTDGCLSDVIQHSRTGWGCSSNISRFQIWPDGSTSGCPYAFRGSTGIGRTAESIVENIKAAGKRYEFRDQCHLPATYVSLQGRSSNLAIVS